MVVSKAEFQDAMRQINESWAGMVDRIQKLEARIEELEKEKAPAKRTTKAA